MVPKSLWSTFLAHAVGLTLALVTQHTSLFAQGQSFPADQPMTETMPGFSLYWHQPRACLSDSCVPSTCPTNRIPTWYSSAEVLGLYRDETRDVVFQRNGTTGADVLRSDNFDIDFDAGTRLVVGRSLGDWYRIEGTYFGTFGWSDTVAARNLDAITRPAQPGTGNLYSPFSNFGNPQGIAGVDFNTFANVGYGSSFANAEINLRRRVRMMSPHRLAHTSRHNEGEPYLFQERAELSVLLGMRYVNLDDSLNYLTQSNLPVGGTVNSVLLTTTNDLIGPQIGFMSQFLAMPRTWVDIEGKAGIFANDIQLQSTFQRTNNAGAVIGAFEGTDQGNHTSFLGELMMHFNHQFTPRLTLRAGYNAVWLTDVALATQNFSNDINLTASGPVQLQHRGNTLLHGPSLGIVLGF